LFDKLKGLNAKEKLISGKLGYEWKNIYRTLTHVDDQNTGLIELREFDDICYRFKARLTKLELTMLKKQFCENSDMKTINDNQTMTQEKDLINYKKLSHYFGLHKDSLNHLLTQTSMSKQRSKLFSARNGF